MYFPIVNDYNDIENEKRNYKNNSKSDNNNFYTLFLSVLDGRKIMKL